MGRGIRITYIRNFIEATSFIGIQVKPLLRSLHVLQNPYLYGL